jgi:NADH-quinone oxidoreductase subunit G
MGNFIFNGQQVPFKDGENIIDAMMRAGTEIPRYCYHPGLSVVAQCRMCLVEVEGQRKLITACSTPAKEGMVVNNNSAKVKESVAGVQEFLLANHPLDCPICDQAGECSLQDYSLQHGNADSRNDFYRRTYIDVDMGPSIKKNMNRCIHCTRCIRYCDEIGDNYEMVALQRGNDTEIVTVDGNPLMTAYAGGLADVCPVGSLTTKDFRFQKRVWYLRRSDSVCDGCSKGCNTVVSQDHNIIYRLEPRENQAINKWWMCDEGRYGFHYVHSPSRILGPAKIGADKQPQSSNWTEALGALRTAFDSSKSIAFFVCADATIEEAKTLQAKFPKAAFYSYSPSVKKSSEDKPIDHLLRRLDKSPNLKGLESLNFKDASTFKPADYELTVFVSGGKVRPPYGLAAKAKKAIGIGVFMKEELLGLSWVIPGASSLEKSGTFINCDGISQSFRAAIPPIGLSRPLEMILQGAFEASPRKVG